jgi:hypothetical protein
MESAGTVNAITTFVFRHRRIVALFWPLTPRAGERAAAPTPS